MSEARDRLRASTKRPSSGSAIPVPAFPTVPASWGNDPFRVRSRAVHIRNGRAYHNLTLHCAGGRTHLLAGSRPMFLLFAPAAGLQRGVQEHVKFGELAFGIAQPRRPVLWLHEFADVRTAYSPGRAAYRLRDPRLPGACVQLEVNPLAHADGMLATLRTDGGVPLPAAARLMWMFGGLAVSRDPYCPWDPGERGIVRPNATDCRGNRVDVRDDLFHLTRNDLLDVVVCAGADRPGRQAVAEAVPGRRGHPTAVFTSECPARSVGATCMNVAVAWGKRDTVGLLVRDTLRSAGRVRRETARYGTRVADGLRIRTPDPRLDATLRFFNYGADACWRPPAFFHSSTSWTPWYVGWRDLYGPTVCGWHNRVRSALMFHAEHTSHPGSHPRDAEMEVLENAFIDPAKRSYGRIHMTVLRPGSAAAGHHDCDHLFVDFLHHHYCWTGDTEIVRELWPRLEQALRWQKAARDPDNDGLYVNVLNTWNSDSHDYHQGGCTAQSAWLWRNHRAMAEMARSIGADPRPHEREAERIRKALERRLWQEDAGVYGEYVDAKGTVHPEPESASIAPLVEGGLVDPDRACRMLRWMQQHLLRPDGLVSGSRWLPTLRTAWSPLVCETLHMAQAAFHAGRIELGNRMLQATLDVYDKPEVLGCRVHVPLNPQAWGGGVDMLDTASLFQRAVAEGLFGIRPRLQEGRITFAPAFPAAWRDAAIETPDMAFRYRKTDRAFHVDVRVPRGVRAVLRLPCRNEQPTRAELDGTPVRMRPVQGHDVLWIEVDLPGTADRHAVTLRFRKGCPESEPRSGLDPAALGTDSTPGGRATTQDRLTPPPPPDCAGNPPAVERFRTVNLDAGCNDRLAAIFRRTPPEVRYGFKVREEELQADPAFLKAKTRNGLFQSDCGIPFRLSRRERNTVFLMSPPIEKVFVQGYLKRLGADGFHAATYPASLSIPVRERGLRRAYALFVGGASHMQSFVPAVQVRAVYGQGRTDTVTWSNPETFDYCLQHVSRHVAQPLTPQTRPGCFPPVPRQFHADIAIVELDPERLLERIEFNVLGIDNTLGLLGLTLLRAQPLKGGACSFKNSERARK